MGDESVATLPGDKTQELANVPSGMTLRFELQSKRTSEGRAIAAD